MINISALPHVLPASPTAQQDPSSVLAGSLSLMQLPCMLMACLHFYVSFTLCMTVQVPEWILVLGGAGIVTGLALYGYKVGQYPESDLPCIHMHPQTGQDGGLP